jgi:hypothetical protein
VWKSETTWFQKGQGRSSYCSVQGLWGGACISRACRLLSPTDAGSRPWWRHGQRRWGGGTADGPQHTVGRWATRRHRQRVLQCRLGRAGALPLSPTLVLPRARLPRGCKCVARTHAPGGARTERWTFARGGLRRHAARRDRTLTVQGFVARRPQHDRASEARHRTMDLCRSVSPHHASPRPTLMAVDLQRSSLADAARPSAGCSRVQG